MSKITKDGADRHRFGDVFAHYRPYLKRFLTLRMGSEADAADLAQEAYLRLTRVKHQELIEKPEAYLFRISINLANELQLKRKRDLEALDLDTLRETGGDGDDAAFEDALERRADIFLLETILDDLPELYRAILLLRKRDGYSHKEIAERLEISPQTVHTYLKRALAQIRARWPE